MIFGAPYRRDPGDILAGCLLTLILGGIVIVLAVYVGLFILAVVAAIAAAVALVYALVIYIRAMIKAGGNLKAVQAATPLGTAALRWFTFIKNSSAFAFTDNIAIVRNAFMKAGNYKLLSPKKWFWLVIGIVCFVGGSLMIAAVILLHLGILLGIFFVLLSVVLLVLAVDLLIGVGYALVKTCAHLGGAFSQTGNLFADISFRPSASFAILPQGVKTYFARLFGYAKELTAQNASRGVRNVHVASRYPVLSPKKYFLYVTIVPLVLWAVAFSLVLIIALSALFVPLFLVWLLWLCIASLLPNHP